LPSAKESGTRQIYFFILKKTLSGTRQRPRKLQFFIFTFHLNRQYIYHHSYITNINYISQTSHLLTMYHNHKHNSKVHHMYHKFNIISLLLQVHPYCRDCHGGNPDCGEGLVGSTVGDALVGLFEPADGGCTKEKRLHVLDSIENFGYTFPIRGGFQNLQEITARRPTFTTARRH
jgi:hypothetical protein